MQNQTEPIHVEQAMAQMEGSRDDVFEIVDIFLETSPDLISQLQAAVTNRDSDSIRSAAHSLKGAASNICAEPLRETAAAIEQLADGDQHEPLEQALQTIQQQFDALKGFVDSAS